VTLLLQTINMNNMVCRLTTFSVTSNAALIVHIALAELLDFLESLYLPLFSFSTQNVNIFIHQHMLIATNEIKQCNNLN